MAPRLTAPERRLRARSLALVAYGEIGSSLIFALGIVAIYAVGATPWVLLAVGALVLVVTLSYAEGSTAMPEPGGAATFVRRAFSDPAGFVTGWMLFLDYLVVIALTALFVPGYLGTALGWDAIVGGPWDAVVGIGVIAALAVARVSRRVRLYAIAVVVSGVAIVVQVVIAVLGFAVLFTPDALGQGMDLGGSPSWRSIALATTLATLAYTGLETIVNFAAEVREPGRTMPRSLFVGIGAVVVLNVAVAVVGVVAYPTRPDADAPDGVATDLGGAWLEAPLVGVARAIGDELAVGGDALVWVVGVANALILVTVMATAMAGGERLAYSMARYGMLPHAFARPERGASPRPAATLAAAVIAPALIVLADASGDGARFLAGVYSFGVLIAMTAAQAAVVRLRVTEPGLERPFRVPGGVRVGGAAIPVPAVAGAVLTFALWIGSLFTHGGAAVAGPLWLVAGAALYAASRRRAGRALLGRATPAVPDLVPEEPRAGGVRTVLVPLKLDGVGEEVLATAIRLAEEAGARVRVLHVLQVPLARPLDAPLEPGEEERARVEVADAREIAAEHGIEVDARVVRARSLSAAILEEAAATGADLVVLGSSGRWRRQSRLVSPTVEEVLRRAPCEVMVVTHPGDVTGGGDAQ
ncbi:universal stress protein [Miltoncostaea marina]|uniref:universal stress protein n=1 Tax=Miltoncostaea marina TaxID=2843215 RepID=UPI001C3E4805|nr:universal stress protein [Miltoncostaea marina]